MAIAAFANFTLEFRRLAKISINSLSLPKGPYQGSGLHSVHSHHLPAIRLVATTKAEL